MYLHLMKSWATQFPGFLFWVLTSSDSKSAPSRVRNCTKGMTIPSSHSISSSPFTPSVTPSLLGDKASITGMRKSVSVGALHHAKETENRTEKLEQQRNEMKRKQKEELRWVAPNMSWLLSLVRPWLYYWGLSKSMARGKGMILTQSKWVFWPSVSSLAVVFIDLHNICLKFLAPWVLPDPYEKPNTISPWKEPLAYLEPFSGPFKKIFSNLCGPPAFSHFSLMTGRVCKP